MPNKSSGKGETFGNMHGGKERPDQHEQEGPHAVNDNAAGKHLREVEQREGEGEEIRNKALRDMMGEIDDAPAGAVLFIGGVTSPEVWNESRSGMHRRASAQGYDERFGQKLSAQEDDVVFVSHEEMRGTQGGFAQAVDALDAAVRNNPGKKIVCDSNFLMTELLFKPWESQDADAFDALSSGRQSVGSVQKWLEDAESENPDEETLSKSALLEERFSASLEPLFAFCRKYLGGRELVFSIAADNPFALAFFVFATRGSLQPAAVKDVLGKFHGSKKAVEFVRIKDGKFVNELEGRQFKARRVG